MTEVYHYYYYIRHLAAKHKLDLSRVRGTGKDGRVMKSDILAHLEEQEQGKAPAQVVPR